MNDNFVSIIKQKAFKNWKGIEKPYSTEAAGKDFKILHQTTSHTGIPAKQADLLYLKVDNLKENLEFYFIENQLVKIIIEDPDIQNVKSWLRSLGQPEFQQDYFADVIRIKNGEWVFPQKGITLKINEEQNHVFYLTLFNPGTLEDFQQEVNTFTDEPVEWEEEP